MSDEDYCHGYDHGVEDQMDRQERLIAEAERRGAVKALRRAAVDAADIWNVKPYPYMWLDRRADTIENGAEI